MSSRRLYRFALFVPLALFLIGTFPNLFSVAESTTEKLDPLQTKEVDIHIAMIQLLITLTTGAAGVLIAIVFNRYQKEPLPLAQVRRAMTSWAFMGVSLYSGYLSYRNLLRMLDYHYFDLYQARVWLPGQLQFWTFVASIAVVADFVIDSFRKEYEP